MGLIAPLEDELVEGEINVDESEGQDAEPVKHAKIPSQPTPEQFERHRTDHYPYRSWCRWCIMGRGIGWPHMASAGSTVPRVGIDYFFITAGGVRKRDELGIEQDDEGEKAVDEGRRNGKIVKCVITRCW